MPPPGGSCVPGIGIGVIETYGIGIGVIETNDPGIGIGVIASRPSPIEVAGDSVGDVAACAEPASPPPAAAARAAAIATCLMVRICMASHLLGELSGTRLQSVFGARRYRNRLRPSRSHPASQR